MIFSTFQKYLQFLLIKEQFFFVWSSKGPLRSSLVVTMNFREIDKTIVTFFLLVITHFRPKRRCHNVTCFNQNIEYNQNIDSVGSPRNKCQPAHARFESVSTVKAPTQPLPLDALLIKVDQTKFTILGNSYDIPRSSWLTIHLAPLNYRKHFR